MHATDNSIRVLLIEDNPGDARLIMEMLQEVKVRKITLEHCATLTQGLQALSKNDFNILLLDLSLPDSIGFDTFVKVYTQNPQIPIVVLTGTNDEELAIKSVRTGAQDYLVKGRIDISLLSRSIFYAIERAGLMRVVQQELIERKAMESMLRKINRALRILSECNQIVVRAPEENLLAEKICGAITTLGEYQFAWVALTESNDSQSIQPIAIAGSKDGNSPEEATAWFKRDPDSPLSEALKSGIVFVCDDVTVDKRCSTLRAEADRLRYRSFVILPLLSSGRTLGILQICSREPERFDREELKLLDELKEDVAYAIVSIRTEKERRRAEEALRSEQTMLARTEGVAHVGSWEWHIATDTVTWSDELFRIFQRDQREGAPSFAEHPAFYHPDDMARLQQAVEAAVADGTPYELELQAIRKDGETRVCVARGMADKEPGGRTVRLFGSLQDITERRKATEALRESEEKFSKAFQTSPYAITITRTEDGGFIEVNDAFTLIAGYIREEALADSSLGLKLWANEEDRESVVADLRAGRAVEGREYQFRTKSGKNITGLFSAQIIKLSSGPCILSSINDITERKRAEEALRESESRFRALFETSADGILIVALETKIFKYANPSICRMLGYTENELITMNIADIHPKDALQSVMSEFEAQARGEKVLAESLPCIRKDGTIIYADVNAGKIIINGKAYIAGFFRDITERKRAEEVLRESETRFRLVWENSTDGMRITDKDGIIIMANDAYCTMVEKPPGEIEGKRVSIVYEKSQQNKLLRKYQERFRSGIIPPSLERDIILWNGKKMSFQLSNSFLEIPNQAKLLLSVLRDVTEQRRSEIALQESEVRYRSILQSANDAIVTADAEGTIVGWNTGAERMFGYSYVEAVGKLLTGMLPQPYLTEQRNDLNKPGSDIKPHHIDKAIELKGLHKDGTEFPVELSLAMWETNSKHFYTEIIRETSDRKRAEETQLLQTTALESTANGVVITDTSGTIAWVNTAFTEMTGYSFAESIGENPKILKSGGHNDAFYKSLWDTITAGNVWKGEIKNKRKDGTLYTEEMTITPVRDQRGKITHFVAIKQDISERKLVEEALRKSEERYRQFFEDDLTGVYVSTVEGKFISCNPAFVHMFGFSTTEDVFQVDAHSIYRHPEMRKAFVRRITEDKRLENLEMQYLRKDGTPLFCVENAVGIFDDKGALVHIRGYLFDDTKRRLLEDQLRQAQKMESLGTLTGGIAHDFNNILGIIIGHASLLNIQLPDNDVIKKNTDVITKTGMRGAALIKQMLAFARKTEIVFASVQLNNAITEIVKLLEETFPKTIRFTLDLEKDLPSIIGDSTQIHQVLLNLCVNARDAMSEKGEIAIRTNIMRDTRAKAKFFDAKDREYVSLSVSDTGAGMDEATLKRIFEPFFTTKERGKGTGLGLSVVYGIVESHHGFIDVESAPGKGTTILIYFPLTDRRPALENTGGATIEEIPGGNETILFVEDEEALQILGTSTLESKGYKVLLASNGEEAVRMYEQHKDGIHLVLSDMGLPKISGHEIFQILKESNPNLRMILTSGFIEPELRSLILRNGVRDFIQKPYSPIELLRSIRSVLDLK